MRIDGNLLAQQILDKLGKKNITPHLAIILVGDDAASSAYVRQKELKAGAIGAQVTIERLPEDISQDKLLSIIQQYNNSNNIHGIIVQRPLPKHIDSAVVSQAVNPQKDIDAFREDSPHDMPLAKAVLYILEHIYSSNIKSGRTFIDWLKSKSIAVIGKGETGGGPTIALLKKSGVEPTIIDSKTPNPDEILKNADIVIAAIGKSGILNPEALKKGVILISVGMYRGEDGKLHGDFEEEDIKNIASFYTPVPGGIGPVNVAMLLQNLIQAVKI